MKGSTFRRCTCPEGRKCPRLRERRHGTYGYDIRVKTSTGTRTLRRTGFATKGGAEGALELVNDLLGLAEDDTQALAIGDMIFARSMRGGKLPAAGDVRRRLGLGVDPGAPGITVAEWLDTWLAARARSRRDSTLRSYTMHARVWIKPAIGGIQLERLTPGHIEDLLVISPPREASAATRQRVFATLRAALNAAVKQRRISWNPCAGVELETPQRHERHRWSPAEAARFIAYTAGDDLGLMFRVMVLSGGRRGELCGLRWSGTDLDRRVLTVEKTVLELGGRLLEGTPKTRAGERLIFLDAETARMLREHRTAQVKARMLAGEAWQDNDLIFARADGSPWPPDYVSRRFKRLAGLAGVPVVSLHEGGRHTGNSLMRDAGVDQEVRMRQVGHADREVNDRYTHVMEEAHLQAAEQVARLVREAGS